MRPQPNETALVYRTYGRLGQQVDDPQTSGRPDDDGEEKKTEYESQRRVVDEIQNKRLPSQRGKQSDQLEGRATFHQGLPLGDYREGAGLSGLERRILGGATGLVKLDKKRWLRQFAVMTPQELADRLREELQDAFAQPPGASAARIDSVLPPQELAPGTSMHITATNASGEAVEIELPTTLAIGYLADEEAAVDEWKIWLAELVRRLGFSNQ